MVTDDDVNRLEGGSCGGGGGGEESAVWWMCNVTVEGDARGEEVRG